MSRVFEAGERVLLIDPKRRRYHACRHGYHAVAQAGAKRICDPEPRP